MDFYLPQVENFSHPKKVVLHLDSKGILLCRQFVAGVPQVFCEPKVESGVICVFPSIILSNCSSRMKYFHNVSLETG